MVSKQRLLQLGMPALAGGILLLGALSLRPSAPALAPQPEKSAVTLKSATPSSLPAASRPISKPAAAEAVITTSDEERLRGTFDNYRTAVAMGNTEAQQSLEKILRRQPELAIRFAEEDVAAARDSESRESAMKTLNVLRRAP